MRRRIILMPVDFAKCCINWRLSVWDLLTIDSFGSTYLFLISGPFHVLKS